MVSFVERWSFLDNKKAFGNIDCALRKEVVLFEEIKMYYNYSRLNIFENVWSIYYWRFSL